MFYFALVCFTLLWSHAHSTCLTPLGRMSECVSLYDCKELLAVFHHAPMPTRVKYFLRQSSCGYENKKPTVCCGPLPNIHDQRTSAPGLFMFSNVSLTIAPFDREDSHPTSRDKCGIDTGGDRIIGGHTTDLDEFPWFALLGYLPVDSQDLTYQCAGVLINHRYVLSAAHCVVGPIETEVGKLASVRLGEYNLSSEIDCVKSLCAEPVQEIPVHAVYPHLGYSPNDINRRDDISLVRLAQRAQFSYYVQPICLNLPNPRLQTSDEVQVAGFGQTLTEYSSDVKQKVGLQVFNKDECSEKYRHINVSLTKEQICAGGVANQDTCRGDSGGALMRNLAGTWEAVAVVSFGNGCGRNGWPGVYTSVISYLDWIEDTMWSSNVWFSSDFTAEIDNKPINNHTTNNHPIHNHTNHNHNHTNQTHFNYNHTIHNHPIHNHSIHNHSIHNHSIHNHPIHNHHIHNHHIHNHSNHNHFNYNYPIHSHFNHNHFNYSHLIHNHSNHNHFIPNLTMPTYQIHHHQFYSYHNHHNQTINFNETIS